MVEHTTRLGEVHSAYLEARGRAQGASTRRLRWRLRHMPQHSADHRQAAERKAVADELRTRGEVLT